MMKRSEGKFRHLLGGVLVTALLGAHAVVAPAPASAQAAPRVNIDGLSCAALQNVIQVRGAIIAQSTSPNTGRQLLERYVSRRGFCFFNERTEYRGVATTDNAYCSVKICSEQNRNDERKPGR